MSKWATGAPTLCLFWSNLTLSTSKKLNISTNGISPAVDCYYRPRYCTVYIKVFDYDWHSKFGIGSGLGWCIQSVSRPGLCQYACYTILNTSVKNFAWGMLLQPWPNAFGMWKHFSGIYIIPSLKSSEDKKKVFTAIWDNILLEFVGFTPADRPFFTDHPALKSQRGGC